VVLPVDFADARARSADVALRARTSLRIGGVPEFFFEPSTPEEASRVLRECRREGVRVRVLGGGCNLLVGDGAIEGAVLSTRRLRWLRVYPERVEVGAGTSFPGIVQLAVTEGIPVLPGCPGIPGSVGGVVFMNAGGRFGSVGDALLEVTGLDLEGNPFRRFVRDGDLGYRTTVFDGTVVTGAVFRRDPSLDPAAQRRLHDEAMAWKKATQPLSAQSAGCIFKNPGGAAGGRSAGWLIDQAGLKGRRVGGAMVSPLHANFIVNEGRATAGDVLALIDVVRSEVKSRHGVTLELEVRLWP
jgi:UDP-N-acetylmuramate dehydrogenase